MDEMFKKSMNLLEPLNTFTLHLAGCSGPIASKETCTGKGFIDYPSYKASRQAAAKLFGFHE